MKHPIHLIGLGPGSWLSRPSDSPEAGPSPAPDSPAPDSPPLRAAWRIIAMADVLVGGRSRLAPFNNHPAEKIIVGADAASLYARIAARQAEGKRLAVLCSGDSLFYGLGARLAEAHKHPGPEAMRVLPGLSSLQAMAALLGRPWERAISASLHGRSGFLPLAHALFAAEGANAPVFLLTDAATPLSAVTSWLLERGLGEMRVFVAENLFVDEDGFARAEKLDSFLVQEAQSSERQIRDEVGKTPETVKTPDAAGRVSQRVLWLEDMPPAPAFGIEDKNFARENGLISKWPVRAAALACLGIEPGHTVWDIGSGSGAVAVEAARLARCGQVWAVERNPARLILMHENRRRFRALNLEIVAGESPCRLPDPDRIFIGGGLGGDHETAAAILRHAWQALKPGGRMVASCVLLASLERARAELAALGAKPGVNLVQTASGVPLAGDLRLDALNPVFLVVGEKKNSAPA